MKLSKNKEKDIAKAVNGIEQWLNTIHGEDGYYGPSTNRKNYSIKYCGAGFDWRYEGILNARCLLFQATQDKRYLDEIMSDISEICSVQLANGCFRNSYFDLNPAEGGMPHEPAMLAAVCRARQILKNADHKTPNELDGVLSRFVENRLLIELWNRLLLTFNDWTQSEFEFYNSVSVAACIEMLTEYSTVADTKENLQKYINGAADSLLEIQIRKGQLSGAIPLSNRSGSAVSLSATARSMVGLHLAYQSTGECKYKDATVSAAKFLAKKMKTGINRNFLFSPDGQAQSDLVIFGEVADVLISAERVGMADVFDVDSIVSDILERQLPSGAFMTAQGFRAQQKSTTPDWRDIMPVCGWIAKIYNLLAHLHPEAKEEFKPESWSKDGTIGGKTATMSESNTKIVMQNRKGNFIYSWEKKKRFADECDI